MNWFVNAARLPRKLRFTAWVVLLALLFGAAPGAGWAESAKPEKKKKKKKENAESLSFDIPIPIGHSASGIKLPDRDPEGNLRMSFEIGTAYRMDESNLKLENLKIETFDASGNLDMVIEMPESSMNLKTRILTSVNPVTIHRSDFEVTGGNMTFDTRTRQGKFSGPVRMLIFNREGFDSAKESAKKGEAGE